MGKVIILPETTKNPITLIGRRAGYCWGADVSDDKKNYDRGMDCLESNHGRTLEFPNIEAVLVDYSARVIREWYTHIGGAPTRLQASTRYIGYEDFPYVTPHTIEGNDKAKVVYDKIMSDISSAKKELEELGVPREDSAMVLPLGMESIEVDKRNMRNVIDMTGQRLCSRAYWEFRELMNDYLSGLANYSDEWKTVVEMKMKPKCEVYGYCTERYSCGMMPKREAQ